MVASAGTSVWIVIEEEIERELVAVSLERDFPVERFANAKSALSRLQAGGSPSLIVLDVSLPWMSGFDEAHAFEEAASERGLPLIFLTSSGAGELKAARLAHAAADFLLRPVHAASLRHRVRRRLEESQRLERLESLAGEDALTGLANRRRFNESLACEWLRAARARTPLTLSLIDLDCFKSLNDRHGHAAGDEALRVVGNALTRCARRPGDLVARLGGEEFAMLLPQTDEDGAAACAEVARQAIADLHVANEDSTVAPYLTASVGVVTALPEIGATSESAMQAADRALYGAKRDGRNKVRCASWRFAESVRLANEAATPRADARPPAGRARERGWAFSGAREFDGARMRTGCGAQPDLVLEE